MTKREWVRHHRVIRIRKKIVAHRGAVKMNPLYMMALEECATVMQFIPCDTNQQPDHEISAFGRPVFLDDSIPRGQVVAA